jgi:hypothetical protein
MLKIINVIDFTRGTLLGSNIDHYECANTNHEYLNELLLFFFCFLIIM